MSDETTPKLKAFVWRKRNHLFIVAIAKTLDEARTAASEQEPTASTFIQRHAPEIWGLVKAGLVLSVRQRG